MNKKKQNTKNSVQELIITIFLIITFVQIIFQWAK